MLGNVGLKHRLAFSAFGSAVNEAQRLESLTKKFGTPVIASEIFTNYSGGDWVFRGKESLKGVRQKVPVYSLSDAMLVADPALVSSDELLEARSDAEQVMLLYRDSRNQKTRLLDSIRR
jgi:adenylate cyclase